MVSNKDARDVQVVLNSRLRNNTVPADAAAAIPLPEQSDTPERALRLSEELCRGVVETSTDAIGLADASGKLVMVNQRAVDLFGYPSADAMLGQSALDLIASEDRVRAADTIERRMTLKEIQGRNVEYTLVRLDGSTVPAEVSSTVIKDDEGRPVWLAIVARDITERRLAEERQHQVEQQKDVFLSAIAHDLKAPLTAIKGRAQLLKRVASHLEGPDAVRIIDGLADLDAAATRMTKMIGELLEMNRLTGGGPIELNRQEVDLVSLVRRLAEDQQRTTERHVISVSARETPVVGWWDPLRLERAIGNLLVNAVKYTPGGGAITVTVDADEEAAIVAVRDEGIGIPAADLAHVFERFHRGGNVIGSIGGTGIGLSAALQIIKYHGGAITVESHEGMGSTFVVRLSFAAPEHAE